MMTATLLALVAAAAPVEGGSARVFLKAPAAAAPGCKTTRVDAQLVRAGLFSPDAEKCPVAIVGDEPIPLAELALAVESQHMRRPRSGGKTAKPDMDFTPALDRLVATRLIVQEAREMRLDEDPVFRKTLDEFKASRLRAMLQRIAARGVKPDPAEVERLYREAVREWKLKSILVKKEDAAKAFKAALDRGESFDALAKKLVADKQAEGGGPAEFVSPNHMLPEIAGALRGAKQGVPIGPIQVPNGWVVLRADGARYPEKKEAARADARAQSLARMEHEAVRRFYQSLVAKYAKVDKKLLDSIDLEAKGAKGFEALMQDQRPLATVQGEKPLTVADLTREVSLKFFHGLEGPIREKRVNREKVDTFERLLGVRVFAKEAAARKLETQPSFVREVEDHERALTFNSFVEKVIMPDVKVTESDAMAWYEGHKGEFTTPQMYKLDGFAFGTMREAQAALDKLKGGTDYPWLRQNAVGQLPPEQRTLQIEGLTLSAGTLPKDLANVLTGTRSGDYRLYAAKPTEVWVIRVVEHLPPAAQPYAQARETIAKRLYNERLAAAIGDYAAKLRKAQPVEVLITRVTL